MNLMKQFSIMGPTDCKQNNIQLQYRHTHPNRILIFHSSGNEIFLTALLPAQPHYAKLVHKIHKPPTYSNFPKKEEHLYGVI
jgi:hypothetical protein